MMTRVVSADWSKAVQIDKLAVNIRPLATDKAIDLGFNIAQVLFLPLLKVWYQAMTYPIIAMIVTFGRRAFMDTNQTSAVLASAFFIAMLLLRSIAESYMLLYLSYKIFEKTANFKLSSHTKTIKKHAVKIIFTYGMPSFYPKLAIRLLENQTGKAFRLRASALGRGTSMALFRLNFVFIMIEIMLFWGGFTLLSMLFSSHINDDVFGWYNKLSVFPFWLFCVMAVWYLIIVSVLSVFRVASGFSVYLCKRSQLEAWDIELEFRKLAQRIIDDNHKGQ